MEAILTPEQVQKLRELKASPPRHALPRLPGLPPGAPAGPPVGEAR